MMHTYSCDVWFHDEEVKGKAKVKVNAEGDVDAYQKAKDAVLKQFKTCPVVIDRVTTLQLKKKVSKRG